MFSVLIPKTQAVENVSDGLEKSLESAFSSLTSYSQQNDPNAASGKSPEAITLSGAGRRDSASMSVVDSLNLESSSVVTPSGMDGLYIGYARTDDYANYPNEQFDFGTTIGIWVDVDNSWSGTRYIDIFVYLRTPNQDIIDGDSVYNIAVTGTGDSDAQYLTMYNGYDYMQYAGTKWHILIIVRDHYTYNSFDQMVFITIGPIFKDHFTCKDPYNAYATKTTTFYDTETAWEYTTWDTHNLWITYEVKWDFNGPGTSHLIAGPEDLPPGQSNFWAAGGITGGAAGSWYVDVLLNDVFRARDGFDIIPTVLPTLDVSLVSPSNGATIGSPVELRARVTSSGSSVQDALVRFYVDLNPVGNSYSNSSGYASVSYSPSIGTHNWKATAEKSGYNSGTSPTWSFSYEGPPDFAISAVPSSITIQAGSSGTTTVNVDSLNSFSFLVTLGFPNPPPGVTPSFNPPSVTPPANGRATSTLTLMVSTSATPGFYQPKITGTCTAPSLYHEYVIDLTITALPALQVSITHDLSRDYFMPEKATFTVEIRDSSGNLVAPNTMYGSFDGSDVTGRLINTGTGRYSYRTDPLYCDLNAQSKMAHTLFVRAQKTGFSEGTASDTIQVHRYDIRLVFSGSRILYDPEKYYPVDGLRFDGDFNIANNKANYVVSQTPTMKDSDSLADAASYVTVKTDGSYYVVEYWIYYAYDNKYLIPNIGSVPSPLRHEHDFEYLFIWVSQSSYSIKRVSLNQHLWTNNYDYTTTNAPQPMYVAAERGGHGMVIANREVDGTFEVVKPANSPTVAPLIDGKFSESAGSFQASLYPWKYYDGANPTDDGFGDSTHLMKSHVTAGETYINPGDAVSAHLDYSVLDFNFRVDNLYQDLTRSIQNAILLESGSPFAIPPIRPSGSPYWIFVKFYLEAPWTREVFGNPNLQLQKIGFERWLSKAIVNTILTIASTGLAYLLKTVLVTIGVTVLRVAIGIAFDPINGTVTDSQGRAVGYKAGELVSEIPGSLVYYTDPSVDIYMIIMPTDDYTYSVQSRGTGSYNLTAIHNSYNATSFFNATGIPVSENSVHNFEARWEAENGTIIVNATIDQNGDGLFEHQFMSDSVLTGAEFEQAIAHDISARMILLSKNAVGEGFPLRINITIENQGNYSEDLEVSLFADKNITVIGDEIIIGMQIVYSLINGTSINITFTWNTTGFAKGNYTISAYAWPVPSETDTTDNTLTEGWVIVTISGDINGDFKVGPADFALLSAAYGSTPDKVNWNSNADINSDDRVGPADFALLSANYGKHYP